MNPEPFTLRELCDMAEGRQRQAWQHTSMLAAGIYRMSCDPKKPPKPHHFNPFHEEQKSEPVMGIGDLRTAAIARGWKLTKVSNAANAKHQAI